jgi:hypothetical protein
MTRLEANREILKLLSDVIEANPDMRFWQVVKAATGLVCMTGDVFYEESTETLNATILGHNIHSGPKQVVATTELIRFSKSPRVDSHKASDGKVYTIVATGRYVVDGEIRTFNAGDTIPLDEIKNGIYNVLNVGDDE